MYTWYYGKELKSFYSHPRRINISINIFLISFVHHLFFIHIFNNYHYIEENILYNNFYLYYISLVSKYLSILIKNAFLI